MPSIPENYRPYTTGTRYIMIYPDDYGVITWGVISLIAILCLAATISVLLAPFRKSDSGTGT